MAFRTEDQPLPALREQAPLVRQSIRLLRSSFPSTLAIAAELGGAVNEREWEFEGAKVCDGHDPEGNVFQLRQAG